MPASLLKFINPLLYSCNMTGLYTKDGSKYMRPEVGPILKVPSTFTTIQKNGKTYGRTGYATGDTFILNIPNSKKAGNKVCFEFTCCANQSFGGNYFYVGFANLWQVMFDMNFRWANYNNKLYANKNLLDTYELYGNYTIVQEDSVNFRIAFNDYPNLSLTRVKCIVTDGNRFEFFFNDNKVAVFNTTTAFKGSALIMLQQNENNVDFTDVNIKNLMK